MKITIQELSKSFGGRDIFNNFSLEVDSGVRLCVCGPNGTGKSTLLRLLAGVEPADGGRVILPRGCRLGFVEQELSEEALDTPLLTYVLDVLHDWNEFWAEWEEAAQQKDEARLTQLMHRQAELEATHGYNPEHRAKAVLSGLGFAESKWLRTLRELSGGTGYDDVICFAPVKPVVEQAGDILGFDGCLNFFAGPTNSQFKAEFNWYNVHYLYTHVVGTSGGNTDDMKEAIEMMTSGKINPAAMVTHIGGLDAVVDTTLNLPNIRGGKKLIYTQIEMPLVAIADFAKLGETDPMFATLDEITKRHNGLWSAEAEKFLLKEKM